MLIYTIIVTYNGMKWVDFCLGSLRKSTVPTVPVIIDNNSSDGTVKYIRSNYPEGIIFEQKTNLGFGQANNVGLRYAIENKADYVLLLNQDAAIHPESVKYLLQNNDGESLFSPIHLNGNGSGLDNNFRYSLSKTAGLLDDLILNRKLSLYETGEVCAACWFMPISLIRKIGGFNPLFFHYGEDNNYYRRLLYHGIKTYVVTDAFMYHDRKVHGNIVLYNNKSLYRKVLLLATDINLSLKRKILRFAKLIVRCYVDMFRSKYIPFSMAINLMKLLPDLKKIQYSVRAEKKVGTTWL